MKVRFYNDPESGEPHMARHGVNEQEARDVLVRPLEDCPGQEGSRGRGPDSRRAVSSGNLRP